MNDGKIYMTDETGREICIDHVHNIEITSAEPEGEGISRSFSLEPFEATITDLKIDFHTMHILTGTESNNERRRHHEPMKRRRKIVYINGVSLGQWRFKKIYKAYTHYGRRTG